MTGRRLIALFSLLALVLLFSAGRNATVSQAAPAAGHHFVRVAAADIQAAAQVGLNPVRAFDYGAFQWLELTDADFTRLAASGAAYTEVLDAGYVHVPGYRFDPLLDGEPTVTPNLQAGDAGAGFRLVQLAGPTNDVWLARLEANGFIERITDPDDRRIARLSITSKGIEVSEYVENLFVRELRRSTDAFSTTQVKDLSHWIEVLRGIREDIGSHLNLDPHEPLRANVRAGNDDEDDE